MAEVYADLYEFIDIDEDGNKTSKQYYFTPDINQFLENNPTLCLAQIKDITPNAKPNYRVISHGSKQTVDTKSPATGFFINKMMNKYSRSDYDVDDLDNFIVISSTDTANPGTCAERKMIDKMNPDKIVSVSPVSIQVISSKSEAAPPTQMREPKLPVILEDKGDPESGGNRKSKPRKKNTTKRKRKSKRKTKRNRYSALAI